MILVTGSKEGGTALWMQILVAAGHPPFGGSGSTDPNRDGRSEPFEASLRGGIYFATNPSPVTGQYVFPEQVARHAFEMLPFGVTRTDRAYIGHVVVTLRPLREYVASVRRLHALEDATSAGSARPRLDPSLEWWAENHGLVTDVAIRQYPARFETMDRLLRDPVRVITEAVQWLGSGDAARAVDAIKPERRSFETASDVSVGPEVATVCDELYGAIDAGQPLSASLLAKLGDTHRALLPRLREEEARLASPAR